MIGFDEKTQGNRGKTDRFLYKHTELKGTLTTFDYTDESKLLLRRQVIINPYTLLIKVINTLWFYIK